MVKSAFHIARATSLTIGMIDAVNEFNGDK